jgi:hypothetical protein
MHREQLAWIGPHVLRREPGAAREFLEIRDAVFVRILGVDLLAVAER